MKQMMRIGYGVFILLLLAQLQGCSKSTLVATWKDAAIHDYTLDKVLVIAVFKDPVSQQIFENSFVSLFEKYGVEAVAGSSYDLTGPDAPREAAVNSAIEKSGADSVLIIHVLSITTETYHDPPVDDYVSYDGYWSTVTGYHSYVYHEVWAGESSTEDRYERMEVTLFDVASGKPVWSARSKSKNFEDMLKKDDEQLEKLFLADLRKDRILR